ncbi:MAG: hypothetical protein PHE53_08665 [Thermoguttaceae bacterium]|nr:hypothetical protein [Thermoguttaceae bacterium]
MAILFGAIVFVCVAIIIQNSGGSASQSKESTTQMDDSSAFATIDASQSWRLDEDVEVVIRSISRGPVEMRPDGQKNTRNASDLSNEIVLSKESFLKIYVTVRNLNNTKLFNFTGWNFVSSKPTLRDNYDNRYRMAKLDTKRMLQFQQDASIYPNQEVTDLLVFELPIETATSLKLQLSEEPFSNRENADTNQAQVEFSIPIAMVKNDALETAITEVNASANVSPASEAPPAKSETTATPPAEASEKSTEPKPKGVPESSGVLTNRRAEKTTTDENNATTRDQKTTIHGTIPSKTPEEAFGLSAQPIQLPPE